MQVRNLTTREDVLRKWRFEEVELAVVGVDDKVDVMAADLAETKAGLKKEVKRLRSELGLSSTKLKKRRC